MFGINVQIILLTYHQKQRRSDQWSKTVDELYFREYPSHHCLNLHSIRPVDTQILPKAEMEPIPWHVIMRRVGKEWIDGAITSKYCIYLEMTPLVLILVTVRAWNGIKDMFATKGLENVIVTTSIFLSH